MSIGGGRCRTQGDLAHELLLEEPIEEGGERSPELLRPDIIARGQSPFDVAERLSRLDPFPDDGAQLVAAVVVARGQIHDDDLAIDDLGHHGGGINGEVPVTHGNPPRSASARKGAWGAPQYGSAFENSPSTGKSAWAEARQHRACQNARKTNRYEFRTSP